MSSRLDSENTRPSVSRTTGPRVSFTRVQAMPQHGEQRDATQPRALLAQVLKPRSLVACGASVVDGLATPTRPLCEILTAHGLSGLGHSDRPQTVAACRGSQPTTPAALAHRTPQLRGVSRGLSIRRRKPILYLPHWSGTLSRGLTCVRSPTCHGLSQHAGNSVRSGVCVRLCAERAARGPPAPV